MIRLTANGVTSDLSTIATYQVAYGGPELDASGVPVAHLLTLVDMRISWCGRSVVGTPDHWCIEWQPTGAHWCETCLTSVRTFMRDESLFQGIALPPV